MTVFDITITSIWSSGDCVVNTSLVLSTFPLKPGKILRVTFMGQEDNVQNNFEQHNSLIIRILIYTNMCEMLTRLKRL